MDASSCACLHRTNTHPPTHLLYTDAAALVAERVNEVILPLERSSLLHAVSRITAIIKQEVGVVQVIHARGQP